MTDALNLFHAPGSCSRASHIALCEADAAFKLTKVDLASNEQRTGEYLAVNPKGRVPALATPAGLITENPAILTYIAMTHPEAQLAPADPFLYAQMQSFNAYLCATVHVAHAHRVRGYRWADSDAAIEDMKAKAPETVGASFTLIEQALFVGPWALGADFCVTDTYLFTIGQWLPMHGLDIADFPRLAQHQRDMLERPAVKRAIAAESTQAN